MRKKLLIITLCAVLIIVMSALSACSLDEDSGKSTEKVTQSDDVISDPAGSSDQGDLTEDQLRQLEELQKDGASHAGKYWRQEMVIKGEIDPAAPRYDLITVKNIIENSKNYGEITDKFEEKMIYPDFTGGSGINRVVFWFDETGSERIIFTPMFQRITYAISYEDGTNYTEILYDENSANS